MEETRSHEEEGEGQDDGGGGDRAGVVGAGNWEKRKSGEKSEWSVSGKQAQIKFGKNLKAPLAPPLFVGGAAARVSGSVTSSNSKLLNYLVSLRSLDREQNQTEKLKTRCFFFPLLLISCS